MHTSFKYLFGLGLSASVLFSCDSEDPVPEMNPSISSLSKTVSINSLNQESKDEINILAQLGDDNEILTLSSEIIKTDCYQLNNNPSCNELLVTASNQFSYENGILTREEISMSIVLPIENFVFEDEKLKSIQTSRIDKPVEIKFYYDDQNRITKIESSIPDNPNLTWSNDYEYESGNIIKIIQTDFTRDKTVIKTFEYDSNPNPFYGNLPWFIAMRTSSLTQYGIENEALLFSKNNITTISDDSGLTINILYEYDLDGYPTNIVFEESYSDYNKSVEKSITYNSNK